VQRDVQAQRLTFAPHVPADWEWYTLRKVRIGDTTVDLQSNRNTGELLLEVTASDGRPFTLDYQPAISARAKVLSVELNGKPLGYHVTSSESDQHVVIHTALTGKTNAIRIRMKNDFGVAYHLTLPALGEQSQGLRIIAEAWSPARDRLTLDCSGPGGASYDLAIWNAKQVASVEGAKLITRATGGTVARVSLPESSAGYVHSKITFHF